MFDDIKKEMLEKAGEWNGDESGKQEEECQMAMEVIGLLVLVETKLFELR